jgi:hypothetical protein
MHTQTRPKVIAYILRTLARDRYDVVDNTGSDKKIIAGQFPDVLVYKKGSTTDRDLLFVMKIENGGELIDSVPQWKELATAPSTFYIIAPQAKLADAKKLAAATNVKARFGWYTMDTTDEVVQLNYE